MSNYFTPSNVNRHLTALRLSPCVKLLTSADPEILKLAELPQELEDKLSEATESIKEVYEYLTSNTIQPGDHKVD